MVTILCNSYSLTWKKKIFICAINNTNIVLNQCMCEGQAFATPYSIQMHTHVYTVFILLSHYLDGEGAMLPRGMDVMRNKSHGFTEWSAGGNFHSATCISFRLQLMDWT